MSERVRRIDRGELKKPEKLQNGYLKCDGYLTRTGVFPYQNSDKSIRYELRHPTEVFNKDSLESFAMVPVTDDHPSVFLHAENTWVAGKGSIGDTVEKDGDFVRARMLITDRDLVRKIETNEKRELSCGYECDLVEEAGSYKGKQYTHRQMNIRGNHVAVVKEGRAGPESRIRMDANSAAMVFDDVTVPGDEPEPTPEPKESAVALIKRNIDGIDCEMSEQAAQVVEKRLKEDSAAVVKLNEDLVTAKKHADEMRAKVDALEGDVKKKDEELKAAPEKIRADIAARLALESDARKVMGAEAKFDGKSDKDVRLAVLTKVAPDLKLDSESDDYIRARFDIAVKDAKPTGNMQNVRTALSGARSDNLPPRPSLADALKANHDRLRNDWKPKDQKSA